MKKLISKKPKVVIALLLPVQVLCFQLLSGYPEFIETGYSQWFYKYLSSTLRAVTGVAPFPVGQLFLLIIIIYFVVWAAAKINYHVKRKTFSFSLIKNAFWNLFSALSIVYFLFMVMWGLNYNRKPVADIAEISVQNNFSEKEIKELCLRLITLTNDSKKLVQQDTAPGKNFQHEINYKALTGYAKIAETIPAFTYRSISVKSVIFSESMSLLGIAGVFFPFTGEANINSGPPWFTLPFTTCHEMAHQLGFAREEEANYIAYLACRNNPDPMFQYAANYAALKYVLGTLKKMNSAVYDSIVPLLSEAVALDMKTHRTYWEKYKGPINDFQSRLNDFFLKANDQKEGAKSYSLVVQLLLGEFKKNNLNYEAE